MGNIGSHLDLTSGWRRHQARLETGGVCSRIRLTTSPVMAKVSVQILSPMVTGCLDDQMVKIASLQSGGSDLGIGYTGH